jgi:glutamate formiminotransferase
VTGELLECVVNVSEGRRPGVVGSVAGAARPAALLDVHTDPDHHRSVLTLAGVPGDLVRGVVALARCVVAQVDLRVHRGAHPRLGAVDVVPFVPLGTAPMALAVDTARACARRLWEELHIPSFLYGAAAPGEPRSLPAVRAGAFRTLVPDVGGPERHPTAGATAVGARPLLVAYNLTLETRDPAVARRIAAVVRERDGGLRHLQAIGLLLPTSGAVQVSMNLTSPVETTMAHAYDAVSAAAATEATVVAAGELVGLAPRAALGGRSPGALGLATAPALLEDALAEAFGAPPP